MNLPEFSVKQPVATLMVFLAMAVLGTFSFTRLSLDLYPEIEPPIISIVTTWPGASATDIETEVTEKIESWANAINDLDTLHSRSLDNLSIVTCQFDWGTDLEVASNDIRDMLGFVRRALPDDCEDPIIFKLSSANMPVMYLNITADKSTPRLYYLVDNLIGDGLKRVPCVGGIVLHGGLKRQINAYFDMEKIEKFHLSLHQINQILAAENWNLPAGNIKYGKRDYFVRVPARYKNVEEMNDTVIGNFENRPVYLKDVATVKDDFEEQEMYAYGDGTPGILMMVMKQTGTNTVEVVDRVKKQLDKLKEDLPSDVNIKIAIDSSEDIIKSVVNLRNDLYWGLFFVALVTIVFLRQARTALIIIFNIPFSLIVAFVFMYMFDYTINTVTLMAISVSSGMVVDDGIVALENIVNYIERGRKVKTSAMFGTSEMSLAIVASTMTTIVVFAPMMFVGGIAGIIFKPLAFVVVITLSASLLTALMLTPALASMWLIPKSKALENKNGAFTKLYASTEKAFKRVENQYKALLNWALSHRKTVVWLSAAIFFSSLSFIPFISTSFFPTRDTGNISISFRMEEGTRLEETVKVLENAISQVNTLIRPEELRNYQARAGKTKEGISSAVGFEEGTNAASLAFKLVDKTERERTVNDIAKALREYFSKIPGIIQVKVSTTSSTESAMRGGRKPISLEVQGYDLEQNLKFAREVVATLKSIPGTEDVAISQKDPRPELWVEIDRKKASDLGLNVLSIAATLRNYFYGVEATEYRDSGEAFNIVTRFSDYDKNRIENLQNAPLMTMDGRIIRLNNIAKIKEGLGPIEIQRKNRQRIVYVEADIYKRALGDVAADIRTELERLGTPPGITVEMGGDVEDQQEAFLDLTLMLILGITLVYMIMAGLFGSYRDPFIVMFSVPFGISGVIMALYLTGTTFSLLSFMGVIMLMGIVVKNAIILINYIHLLRKRGLSLMEAVSEAGRSRLRPVLMTTFTTIFGMLPLAISTNVGSEGWKALGITMLGGLSVSTLITLLLIPVIYYMFERRKIVKISGFNHHKAKVPVEKHQHKITPADKTV